MNSDNTRDIPLGHIDWGGLRNFNPVSDQWGFDRGKPVDRYYIEDFLQKNRAQIRGHCIEILNNNYTRRFGEERVSRSEILDIDPNNLQATVVGDLAQSDTLPANTFDCFILTQTLPVIYDARAALRNSYEALKPGGTLLITVPALCRYSPHPQDFWRFTDASLTQLIEETTDCENLHVSVYGNLVASIAFLVGAASEELLTGELDHLDRRFPIVISASLNKKHA